MRDEHVDKAVVGNFLGVNSRAFLDVSLGVLAEESDFSKTNDSIFDH